MTEYPSQEYLRSAFSYDQETGQLVAKESRGNRKAGRPVGNMCTHGYLKFVLNGQNLSVARVIWIMHHGTAPEQIDHINRVRDDNRLCNLRAADQITNSRNKSIQRNNTSGAKGINFNKQYGKWEARIGVGKKRRFLGRFSTKELAVAARKGAEAALGYHD